MLLSCIPSLSRATFQKDQSQVSCWSCGTSWAEVSSLHWLDGGEKRAERCCLITAKYQPEDLQQPGSRISEICGGLTCLHHWQHQNGDGVESSRNGSAFPAPSEAAHLLKWARTNPLLFTSCLMHIFPFSLPAHDSSTLAHFVSHPSQGVTTGNVCVFVWAGQFYRAGRTPSWALLQWVLSICWTAVSISRDTREMQIHSAVLQHTGCRGHSQGLRNAQWKWSKNFH